jgi:hypothetical protein
MHRPVNADEADDKSLSPFIADGLVCERVADFEPCKRAGKLGRSWARAGRLYADSAGIRLRASRSPRESSAQESPFAGAGGDGSPESSTVADGFTLSAMSKTSFVMSRRDEPGVAYRWCSTGSVD